MAVDGEHGVAFEREGQRARVVLFHGVDRVDERVGVGVVDVQVAVDRFSQATNEQPARSARIFRAGLVDGAF